MFETLAVFQPAMFWLKADAELNICEPHRSMMHQAPNQRHTSRGMPAERRHAAAASPQSLEAPKRRQRAISPHVCMPWQQGHTPFMFDTLAVFQPAMFWLKADAE